MIQVKELQGARNLLEEAYIALRHIYTGESPKIQEAYTQVRATIQLLRQAIEEEEERYR